MSEEIKKILENHIAEEGLQLEKVLARLEELAAKVETHGSSISTFQEKHDEYVRSQKPMQAWFRDAMSVQRVVKFGWMTIGYIAILVGAVSVTYIAIKGQAGE